MYPTWPPPKQDGFIYPTLEKKSEELMNLGVTSEGFDTPWSRDAPITDPTIPCVPYSSNGSDLDTPEELPDLTSLMNSIDPSTAVPEVPEVPEVPATTQLVSSPPSHKSMTVTKKDLLIIIPAVVVIAFGSVILVRNKRG